MGQAFEETAVTLYQSFLSSYAGQQYGLTKQGERFIVRVAQYYEPIFAIGLLLISFIY